MLTARLDVSGVPPQGGYVAKQCPVRAQWDVIVPSEPLPVSDATRRRFDRGNQFEGDVFDRLRSHHPDALTVERGGRDDRAAREATTLDAMRSGVKVIIGGRLPVDEAARRVGEPDVLVAAAGDGYHPVDVKHHTTLRDPDASGSSIGAHGASLTAPWWTTADRHDEVRAKKRKDDLLQLAHYRRMLEVCGHAAAQNRAGIIGTEESVTWLDLDAPIWKTPSVSEGSKVRSTMEVYDFEFGFRLDVIATAARHLDDRSIVPLVVPVRIGECAECPWWEHCRGLLEAGRDVSLLPRSGWTVWKRHHDRGITSLDELASLDWRTADLLAHGVDLANLFDARDDCEPTTPIAAVIGARKWVQAERLAAAGVETAADADRLDRRVAAYTRAAPKQLAEQIDQARARLHPARVLLRRGVSAVAVPRGDVEVDLDLESTEDGVYLWGTLVTDRSGTGLVDEGYRAFVTWDPLDATTEIAPFESLMAWITELRGRVDTAGGTTTVYCYNEAVEADELRRLAASEHAEAGWTDRVADLVDSATWVDLLDVTRDHLITGGSMGLKALAPLAGFEWEDDDPGGEQSMLWHDLAVTASEPAVRDDHRRRLLAYNRNDVEATRALRDWLEAEGPYLARMEDTDALHGW